LEKILRTAAAVLLCAAFARGAQGERELHIPLNVSKITLDPRGVQDTFSLLVARQLHCQLVRMKGWEAVPEAAQQIRYV
jgi:hypothetical protein